MPTKRRFSKAEKYALARKIALAGVEVVERIGAATEISGIVEGLAKATFSDLKILYTTPAAKLPGTPEHFGIDIWSKGRGKVFSVWWEPLQVINFGYGEWVRELVPDAPAPRLDG